MKRRGAFTLIELLTVMSLVILLVAMLFPTLKYLAHSSQVHTTKHMLETARIMQGEFEQLRNPARDPATFSDWNTATTLAATVGSTAAPNYSTRIFVSDQTRLRIMGLLLAIPNNAKMMEQIPSRQVLPWMANAGNSNNMPPVLLDGWGNPIIFVPAGGLTGVTVGAQNKSDGTTTGGTVVTITAPDKRPFWASPGMDGDFSRGDDNFYSFGN